IVADAASKKGGGSKVDWTTFLGSPEFKSIEGTVGQLLGALKKSDVGDTIKALGEKQEALKGGKALADLPTDKLIQYTELGNVKLVLAGEQVATAMNANFGNWLVSDALPVLVKAAPLVLPLLV